MISIFLFSNLINNCMKTAAELYRENPMYADRVDAAWASIVSEWDDSNGFPPLNEIVNDDARCRFSSHGRFPYQIHHDEIAHIDIDSTKWNPDEMLQELSEMVSIPDLPLDEQLEIAWERNYPDSVWPMDAGQLIPPFNEFIKEDAKQAFMERGLFPHQVKIRDLNENNTDCTILDPDFSKPNRKPAKKPVMEKKEDNSIDFEKLTEKEQMELLWAECESMMENSDTMSSIFCRFLSEDTKQKFISKNVLPFQIEPSEISLEDWDSSIINPEEAMIVLDEKINEHLEKNEKAKKSNEDW